ncbi:hypothetical protein S40293_01023 [Stachybotrys chartarum IBT 40293]|nr:hypothetical protein S40293_01023 [Stachybotrys chartarum IBT 40293]KFA75224.1 hypothetical protein S40288_00155 [Stachybotrys chartarum IBT 40288]
MSAPKPQDPLDALQHAVNDVLVQTGKALRASRKDGPGNLAQAHGSLQSKLPDTIRLFHSALDTLEHDIIRAKSVLQRDLAKIQSKNQPVQQASQVEETQPKAPMVIDVDSSPPPADIKQQPLHGDEETKLMAPFPDMGMGLTDVLDAEAQQASSSSIDAPQAKEAIAPAAPMAPMPLMDESASASNPVATESMPDAGLNFTDMEFTLAPSGEPQDQSSTTAQDPSFDLSTFAPPDADDDLMVLDNLLPTSNSDQAANAPAPPQPDVGSTVGGEQAVEKPEPSDHTFDDVFNMDGGVTDGTDFDFGIDGGLGEDTFDDLMNSRDDNFEPMETGDFDAAFFGLDKTD